MELYDYYKQSRDLTWRLLLDNKLFRFPLDPSALARSLGIHVKALDHLPITATGLSFEQGGEFFLAYLPSGNSRRDRFTIAHELGHILLGHVSPSRIYTPYQEEQANIFASRILAPLVLIKHYELRDAEEVGAFFGLSKEASENRLKRFHEVEPRGKFLTSPLEKKYYTTYCTANGEKERV